jgi:hypothetical protein
MKRKYRDTEVFSLSFLDVICCGFGAIILLLVLSEFGQPIVIERSRQDLEAQIKKLQEELFVIRGESEVLERELRGRVDVLARERRNLAKVAGDVSSISGQFDASRQNAAVSNILENELLSAYQELETQRKLLIEASRSQRRLTTDAVGGIPVDSDYVIFVIDNSGSMISDHWETVLDVMQTVLNIYPRLRGIQVLDDSGEELLISRTGRWLSDTPEIRRQIIREMRRWNSYNSDSNPSDGIQEAIKKYWAQDKRISIYVFGDDFKSTGGRNFGSIQGTIDQIDRMNTADNTGRRRVRIHGIGFPPGPTATPFLINRFAPLMRVVADRNDGTFIGLTESVGCKARIEIGGISQCL